MSTSGIMPVMSTLRFVPGVRRFRRGEALVQFGAHERRARVLPLPDPRLYPALTVLDIGRDRTGFVAEARRRGVDRGTAARFLQALCDVGVVVDTRSLATPGGDLTTECRALALRGDGETRPGEIMRGRGEFGVHVEGGGEFVTTLIAELTASGVTRTRGHDGSRRRVRPDLGVLIDVPRPAGLVALGYRRRGVPYLVVSRMDGIVRIGPMVVPAEGSGACGNCVDLRRLERGGLGALPPMGDDTIPPGGELLERAVRSMALGVLVSHVLAHIDLGRSALIGATVDVGPAGVGTIQNWDAHPDCRCGGLLVTD